MFGTYGRGLATARDSWVYGFSRQNVLDSVSAMVTFFNSEVDRRKAAVSTGQKFKRDSDPAKMSWNRADTVKLERSEKLPSAAVVPRIGMYRPFQKQHVVFDRDLNDMVYKLNEVFPTPDVENVGIYYVGAGSAVPFSVLMLDCMPDLHVTGAGSGGQFFPRYTYRSVKTDPSSLFPEDGTLGVFDELDSKLTAPPRPGFERVDNITDEMLTDYRQSFGEGVSKDDIFFYVYGLLHSREYRVEFEADLKKMLPRIPKVKAFKQFVEAGRALSELHIGYETAEPYPLTENAAPNTSPRVMKMRYAKAGRQDNKTTIIVNEGITLTGIPEEAQEYVLGSRSALDWIIERYQVKTDKASGIVNDPNAWGDEHGNPRYIVDLVKRITTVSVETVRIVRSLPSIDAL